MSTTSTTSTTTEPADGSSAGTDGSSGTSGSESGSDGATGFDPGTACPQIYAAVCGKDGETYDNACIAHAAGVEVRREGPCAGDCEGSCVVAPQGPSLLGLVLVVLAFVRPRARGRYPPCARGTMYRWLIPCHASFREGRSPWRP